VPPLDLLPVCAAILAVALLYSSVGHAGASGYIAVLTLFGFAPGVIKPTALVLNVLVATLAAAQYRRAGHFTWETFWPFAVLSVPFAFAGGFANLPVRWFQVLVGIVLLCSALRFLVRPTPDGDVRTPPRGAALALGGTLGLLAGLTGTGGGIFLTPLLLFCGWARTKEAAAISAVFILVNSLAGLAGTVLATRTLPPVTGAFVVAALAGGTLGAHAGSRRLDPMLVKRLLAGVLTIAGLKLVFA
jgi:hypothetical protein